MSFEGPPIEHNGEEEKKKEFRLPESSEELMRMIRDGEVPKTMMSKVREILADSQVEQRDLNDEERQELRSVLRERGITLREDDNEPGPQKQAA